MLLLLDNYDSFTWNLAQAIGAMAVEPCVIRNDRITVDEAMALGPDAIVISPGPGFPQDAGISVDLVSRAQHEGVPLLGVCLGHQAIGAAFGARVVRAERQMHGKETAVVTDGSELFAGIENPFRVMRYHSLVLDPGSIPAELAVTAWSADRGAGEEVMAIRHREALIWGVQFHPESVGTPSGCRLLRNFLDQAGVGRLTG